MRPRAFHLPALPALAGVERRFGEDGAFRIEFAELTPQLVRTQVAALLAEAPNLAEWSVENIIDVVDQVAVRFLDPLDPVRKIAEEGLPGLTGASLPMIRHILDRMAADWRADRLRTLLRSEFLDPKALDRFTRRHGIPGSAARAIGPRLTTHFFSGNVPGVAVTSLIRALLVKSPSLGKTAKGEPLLAPLFAQALHEIEPELGRCVAVAYWPGGAEELERPALERAEAVIAYGSGEAVDAVRRRSPARARFLGYGHRVSFGVIAREMLSASSADTLAAAAAADIAAFDQQGCTSPHLFYLEEGGELSPAAWAERLAHALTELAESLPRGRVTPEESSLIRQVRGEAEFAQIAGDGTTLHASRPGTDWTVIHDPAPEFAPSCLNRTIRIKPVASLEMVPALVAGVGEVLQSVGVAAPEERAGLLAEQLARIGASRVCEIGTMAWPPPHWLHDGRPPLGDLVRWCERTLPAD